MNKSLKNIAVVGTGIMGTEIARNFLKHGYRVYVWNRSKNKLKRLISLGVIVTKSPKNAASRADIVFEVTANDKSSRSVWLGKRGILEGANPKSILITNATLSISWIEELNKTCLKKKLTFMDIPVTGSRIGAETGQLVLLVGGSKDDLRIIEKDLKVICRKIYYFGKIGSGMKFKLLLNILQAIHIQALGEVLRLAKATGIDIKKVGSAFTEIPGGTATNLAWRDYQADPDPVNFSIKWITKDLQYAKELAPKINTPLLNEVLKKYQKAIKRNLGKKDWTVINKI